REQVPSNGRTALREGLQASRRCGQLRCLPALPQPANGRLRAGFPEPAQQEPLPQHLFPYFYYHRNKDAVNSPISVAGSKIKGDLIAVNPTNFAQGLRGVASIAIIYH